MNGRIRWVDIAKGIGIFLVVLGHCQITEDVLTLITTFHMPLFFFLAGYVFRPERYSSFSVFFKARVKSILVPYAAFTLLSILFSFSRTLLGQGMSLEMIVGDFLRGGVVESNPPLWFLRTIFFVEVLFFLLNKIKLSDAKAVCLVYLGFAAVFLLHWDFYTRMVNGLLFYSLGYLAKRSAVFEKKAANCPPMAAISGVGFALGFAYVSWKQYHISISSNSHLLPCLMVTHLGILFVITCSMTLRQNQVLEYLGRNSLVILCVHVLVKDVLSVLLKLVWKLDTFMDDVSNGYALLTTLAILVGCCAAAEFINRFCPWILGKSRQKAIK